MSVFIAEGQLLWTTNVLHSEEHPMFIQRCLRCSRLRARIGEIWINEEPDEGWYEWWPDCEGEKYGFLGKVPEFYHPCNDCARVRGVLWTLKQRFGTLENIVNSVLM